MEEVFISKITPRTCSAPGCMMNIQIAKRHYFRFPKEKDRWMEWLKACNRMDLVTLGPEVTSQYYRLCHLHFRVEMFRNIEGKIYLSKEAVPSIFLKLLQTENGKSMIQPISFVTIFLKPENKNKSLSDLSSKDLTTSIESEETQMVDKKDTPIISSLQALFPRASIKQTQEEKNTPAPQSILEAKSEWNNRNNATADTPIVKDMYADSAASTSSLLLSPKENNNNGCSSLSLVPTTSSDTVSKTVSTTATRGNNNRTSLRRRWHVSTQTPKAWICVDSFLGKRQMEKIEIDEGTAKRSKQTPSSAENEDAQQMNTNDFKAACADLLPRNSALLISACVDARERGKAMQHSFEGKQFALELFLMAPDAYRLYRPLCLLPTVCQLWRHIRNWDVPPGLNDNVLNALSLKMKSLPAAERRCSLCVNEMRLQPHLFYNLTRDQVVGFHDTGTEKRYAFAKKALVLVARSIAGDWEQPIAYYFCSTTTTDITKNLIFQAITRLKDTGVTVHVLITGTAPLFLRLSRELGISAENPWFLVNDEKIFYVLDVMRLMRATRNVLMNYELCFEEKKASWTDIELLYRRDNQMRQPLVPKLSAAHLEPNPYQRTETKYAVQVFSSAVAVGLSAHITFGGFPLRAIGTMEFVRNFDQLFDIMNSSSTKSNSKNFGQAFTGSAHEMFFLRQMLDFLKSIRIIDRNGKCVKSIRCFENWRITINAVIHLWSVLKEHRLPYLCTARLNRESVERVFRSVKRQSENRACPTPILFVGAFKNLISKHLLEHSSGGDATANARKMLKRIASSTSTLPSPAAPAPAVQVILSVATTKYRDIDPLPPEETIFKRVCEYLFDECSRAHNCDVCTVYVRDAKKSPEGVPDPFSAYVLSLDNVFTRNFETLVTERHIGARMLELAQQIKYESPCPNFPMALLVKLYLRTRIFIMLSRCNKIWKKNAEFSSLKD